MKDNFSAGAADYAKYRLVYPQALFDFLLAQVSGCEAAWDCGTGNGQVAAALAARFRRVFATDISAAQLQHAAAAPNIIYSIQPAEETDFTDNLFDLIIAAQAVHWFDFGRFYSEVRRTAKPGAVICAAGYGIIRVSAAVDRIINDFYSNVTRPYWDDERRYIDDGYRTIPFPFSEIAAPVLESVHGWSLAHLAGYLRTWSGVRHFITKQGYDPVELLTEDLRRAWGAADLREVRFPLLLRVGRVEK